MFWKLGIILGDCWNFRSWGPRWKTQVTWDIPLKVTSSLLSSAPTPSHDPCFMSAMRWRAHSAVGWTEHRELRAKTKNSSQASSRYSVTGMRKAIQCEHKCYVCMESIFSQCLLCTHDSSQGAQKHCWWRCTHTLAGKPAQQHRAQENHCILCCEVIPNTLCHLNDLGFSAIRNWGAMLLSRIPLKWVTHLNCSLPRWL